jgi:predicted O-linked N-acetylglucosamine transferase (SPINDLY family)
VARDQDDFERLAIAKAADLPALARLRQGLRQQVAASPLCDGKRFAQSFRHTLRQVWQSYCALTG